MVMLRIGPGGASSWHAAVFILPEVDDEVLVAFLHGPGFEPLSLGVLETRLHEGAGLLHGLRAIFLIRPAAAVGHDFGRPKWGDVVLKAAPDDDAALPPLERLWVSDLPAPGAAGMRRAACRWTVGEAGTVDVCVTDASGSSGRYVLTSVSHVGHDAKDDAAAVVSAGLRRRH